MYCGPSMIIPFFLSERVVFTPVHKVFHSKLNACMTPSFYYSEVVFSFLKVYGSDFSLTY
jgi:hypothetical protein